MNIKLIDMKITMGNDINNNNNDVFVDFEINEDEQIIVFNALIGGDTHSNRWKIIMTYQLMSKTTIDYESDLFLSYIRATIDDVAGDLIEVIVTLDSLIKIEVN